MKNLIIVLLMLFLVACASQSAIVKSSAHIKPGMSDAELRQVMGEPQNRQFKGKSEAWQYCSTAFSGFEDDHFVLVWIFDGVVTGMETYRDNEFGTCDRFFRAVKWEEAPNTTIETRKK